MIKMKQGLKIFQKYSVKLEYFQKNRDMIYYIFDFEIKFLRNKS